MAFQKATKKQARLRLALIGPSGSGKTYSALNIAQHLGEKVAVIDTERGSASKYADIFQFDVTELESFHPQQYINAIQEAEAAGYDVLVIDSLSHAWVGKDGVLELVDKFTAQANSTNKFGDGWRKASPLHNTLVDAILRANLHIITTMRVKMEYVQEKDERGKTVIRKVGLQPIQRDGLEYEFDVVADLDMEHRLIVGKTRCLALDGAVIERPGEEVANTLKAWLTDGAPVTVQTTATETPKEEPKSASNSTGASKPAYITDAQRKRLFAIAKKQGYADEDIKAYLMLLGFQSSKEITTDVYDSICSDFETKRVAKAEQTTEGG